MSCFRISEIKSTNTTMHQTVWAAIIYKIISYRHTFGNVNHKMIPLIRTLLILEQILL